MPYNNKYPEIKRTGGAYPRNRYGVCYTGLSIQQKRLLLENPILKERAQSDQFLHILFEVCRSRHNQHKNKYYYDRSTEEFVQLEELKESYDTIDWTCAISGEPIRSNINDFSVTNFVHPDYHDTLSETIIDSRILASSLKFQQHIKKLLLDQQKEFINLARKNSKRLH
jgi:hypothetical protein